MKKHFLLAAGLALVSSIGASATVVNQVTSFSGINNSPNIRFIPNNLVSVDSPRILNEYVSDDGTSRILVLLNDNFQEVRRVVVPYAHGAYEGDAVHFYFYDLNNDFCDENEQYISQTLFNYDDKYEYVVPVVENIGEYDAVVRGYKIINDEGETLTTITPPAGYSYSGSFKVFKTEAGFFISVYGASMQDSKWIQIVYKIDRSTSSIQQISANMNKMDVSPRVARQTPVTVTFDENSDYTSIDLINMSGRVVRSIPLKDEKVVNLETTGMSQGMYIVKASGNNQSQETCKIIIQ